MTRATLEDEMFEVPEQYLNGLEKLATLEDKLIKGLLQSIEALPPDFDLQKIASFAESKYGIDIDDASAILNSIAALYFHIKSEDISSSIVIDAICENLKKDLPTKTASKYISKLKARLSSFLGESKFLEIIYQAADLLPENENILADARLLTDIRPIFKDEISDGISASLISHVLRLQYDNINGTQEIFISLSSSRIEQLIEELQESLAKELALRKTFEKINIPCLIR
jgi:hypothetical protein